MPLHLFPRLALGAVLGLPALLPVTGRAGEIGVIGGQTWTRNEDVGPRVVAGSSGVVGTGRCLTVAFPFTHALGGPWSLAIVPTHYHLEYHGPAVSSAEIPVMLRWSARSTWSPYVEAGGGLHLGAGLALGDERRSQVTPCVDAGVGVIRRGGARHLTLAVHTVSAPQNGEWARRVSVLAGLTQSIATGDVPPRGPAPRRGGLVEPQLGRVPHPRITGYVGYSHAAPTSPDNGDVLYRGADSVAAGSVRDAPGDEGGPAFGVSIDLSGPSVVSLRLAPAVATRGRTHDISVDGALYARGDERLTVLSVPVQIRVQLPHSGTGPYLLIGPTLSGSWSHRQDNYSVVATSPPPPYPFGGIDVSLSDVFDPTVGVQVRALGRRTCVEVRSLASFTSGRRDTFSVLLGVDLTAPPR